MNNYRVVVRIFDGEGKYDTREICVEAGNKKIASLRALAEIGKIGEYAERFKSVISVEPFGK